MVALDLEGTLISTAISMFPRPGLRSFIAACLARFEEVVIYSSVTPSKVRTILCLLAEEGLLPDGFAERVRIIQPSGTVKDLLILGDPDDILLIDDMALAAPGQEHRLLRIAGFEPPYADTDDVLITLAAQLNEAQCRPIIGK